MRNVPGRRLFLGGNEIYVEESGAGDTCVVFESGTGAGRLLWDPVVALLADSVRTVAYDRAGRGRSKRIGPPQSIDDMADTLAALIEQLAPQRLILVAHSMGGLVVRRAIDKMSPQPIGLVLVDPTPEQAPIYDDWTATVKKTDRILAVEQSLSRIRPLMAALTRSYGRMFPAPTYATMLAEDFTPAGFAQTRDELHAVAASITEFRTRPPRRPDTDVIVISAAHPTRFQTRSFDAIHEYQRRYAEEIGAVVEDADSTHLIPAERPAQIAAAVRRLSGAEPRGAQQKGPA
ncbi:alpha/beta fold hydrolase [Nocardia tengchongensis]